MSVNHFIGIGNLTRDPEFKTTKNGKSLATFAIALNERGKNKEEYTSFIEVECWEGLAQVVKEHLCKGRKVHIHGRLKQERWDSENGKRSRLIVVAREIEFLDSPVTFDPKEFENEGKE